MSSKDFVLSSLYTNNHIVLDRVEEKKTRDQRLSLRGISSSSVENIGKLIYKGKIYKDTHQSISAGGTKDEHGSYHDSKLREW
jgi:hypothetical protein